MLSPKQVWPLLKQTFSDWLEDKAPKLAASLALYAMLSLAPLLVIVTKIIGVMYRDEPEGKVTGVVAQMMPGIDPTAITQMIKSAGEHGSGLWATVISSAIAIFGATGVFGELQDSMNTIWEVKPKPNQGVWGFIRTRFLSFAMVLGLAFLFMISTVGTTLVTTLGERFAGDNQIVALLMATVVSLGLMSVLFAMIFKLLPDVKMAWSDVWIGAILTAVLFEVGKYLLAWYLKGSSTQVYGAAGSLAALLLWIYYSAQILFFGAEFTQVYAHKYGSEIVPSDNAEPITAEARAQQGRPSQKDSRSNTRGDNRGGTKPAYRQPVPSRKVVTIEQPAQMNRQGYLLAAGGLAAGVIIGAAGVFTGRKWGEPKLTALQINERLNALQNRIGEEKSLKRYGKELALMQRVAQIEERVSDAATSLKQTVNPPWYVKLAQPRNKKTPTGWYSRIKEYVS